MLARLLALVAIAVVSLTVSAPTRAAVSAQIAELHRGPQATFGRDEQFWVRIEYTTDAPTRLWVRPYHGGKQIQQAMTHASRTYTGAGEALGWFSLIGEGYVDEVRVLASGHSGEQEVARLPVQLRWTTGAARNDARPQWVDRLLAVDRAAQAEEARRRASEPASRGEVALFSGFMLLVVALMIAGLVVPAWCAWKWSGGWRIAAAIPAGVMLFVVLRIVVDAVRDPTSHNLWPFEILQVGVVGLLVTGALKIARRLAGAGPGAVEG
jgi:hypothetical protein